VWLFRGGKRVIITAKRHQKSKTDSKSITAAVGSRGERDKKGRIRDKRTRDGRIRDGRDRNRNGDERDGGNGENRERNY